MEKQHVLSFQLWEFIMKFIHTIYYYFIFKLYNIVLVLPNIEMNPPQVYPSSPSWTLLPPLPSLWVVPVHQPQASSTVHRTWTGDSFFGRDDAKAVTPVLWPTYAKSWLIGKDSDAGRDWGQEEKGTTEDEMAGWHHRLDGWEFEWTPGDGNGQGGLACCSSWGRKE